MTVLSDLRQSVRDEKRAEASYLRRAGRADIVTADLYRHIAAEERVHAREFGARIKALERKSKGR